MQKLCLDPLLEVLLLPRGSGAVTQGFCPDISSSLLISSLAALYGLSHHGLAVLLLPASPCRVPQKQRPSPDRSTAEQQVTDVCVCLSSLSKMLL